MNGGLDGHTMQHRSLIGSVRGWNKHSQGIYIAVRCDTSKKPELPPPKKKILIAVGVGNKYRRCYQDCPIFSRIFQDEGTDAKSSSDSEAAEEEVRGAPAL